MIAIQYMKKILYLGVLLLTSSQALAISEGYRQQLRNSGCTQMTDGSGCDIRLSKSQNEANAAKQKHLSLNQIAREIEPVIGMRSNVADEYLFNRGWRTYGENEYIKAGWKIRLVIDRAQNYEVINAQVIGKV